VSYSSPESVSPLAVRLMFDASSGTTTLPITVQIIASAQGGDTATGIRNYSLFAKMLEISLLVVAQLNNISTISHTTEGVDFTGTTCSLTLPAGGGPGDLSAPCDVPITNDLLVEQDETFSLSASVLNSNGQTAMFTVGGDSASATIIDDDSM